MKTAFQSAAEALGWRWSSAHDGYISEGHRQQVRVLDRKTLKEIPQGTFGHVGQYRDMFLGLHVIITDAKGNIYTGDGRDGRVLRFNFVGLGN